MLVTELARLLTCRGKVAESADLAINAPLNRDDFVSRETGVGAYVGEK